MAMRKDGQQQAELVRKDEQGGKKSRRRDRQGISKSRRRDRQGISKSSRRDGRDRATSRHKHWQGRRNFWPLLCIRFPVSMSTTTCTGLWKLSKIIPNSLLRYRQTMTMRK